MKNKESIFRFAAILLPVAFFAILEVVLRSVNYGGDLSLFRQASVNGKAFYTINPEVARRYFRTYQVRAMSSNDVFEKEKGPNTWRVFCLGESSTLGYPYFFNGTFPSMLRDRLETLWPEKKIEVVNLGITAVSSYTVLDFVKELPPYKPDAILIYCGHNEFYGALGTGSTESLGQSRWAVKAYLELQGWRTFRLIRDGMVALKGMVSSSPDRNREATVMEGMVGNREIAFGSKEYQSGISNFRENIEEMVRVAAQRKIPLVLGTLVSNLSGMEPFVSIFSTITDERERGRWEELNRQGTKALEEKRYEEAARALNAAVEIDSVPAKAHFALGQAFGRIGRLDESRRHYRLARDLDALRFRAPSEFNSIIKEVGRAYNVPVADGEALMEGRSEHGIIGNRFVLEHVHLSLDGYFLLAKAFAGALAENGILAPRSEWKFERDLPDSVYRERVGVTPLDSVAAAIRLHVLMNSWPFRESGVGVQSFPVKTELERVAKSYLMKEMSWEEAHVRMAERYEGLRELKSAAAEYHALARATPYNVSPWLRLGRVLLDARAMPEAEAAFKKSLRVEESYHAYHNLGFIHLKAELFRDATIEFQRALRLSAGINEGNLMQSRYFLAVAQAAGGEYSDARKTVASLLADHPEFQPARELSARMEQTSNHPSRKTP